MTYPVHIPDQKFENSMDLLLISNYYVYIKDFVRYMFNKTKNKNKKYFYRYYLQCFSSKNVLTEHKETCLKINGAQTVKLKKKQLNLKIILDN